MDRSQANNFKNKKIRLVEDRMTELQGVREESYEKNQAEIDQLIEELVGTICQTQPLNPKALARSFQNVIDSLFYAKRPSKKVISFLNDISCYPPEVIYDSILSFSMKTNETIKRKKPTIQYFHGILRNNMFKFKEKLSVKKHSEETWGMPDDL